MRYDIINTNEWRDLKWFARLAYCLPHGNGEVAYDYTSMYEYRNFELNELRIVVDYMMSLGSYTEPIDQSLIDIGDALLNYASLFEWLGMSTAKALPYMNRIKAHVELF